MKNKLLLGTAILTCSGLICRLIGFLYRIFLSRTIGAEGLGIYQLIIPFYHLSYACTTAGIQTALSRLVASCTAKKDPSKALTAFLTGTMISFFLSLTVSILIQFHSDFFSRTVIGDERCRPLLELLSYTLPFASLQGCILGWFMGRKQAKIPALIQLSEELIRLGATYACSLIMLQRGETPTPVIAIAGLLVGDIFSVLISFLCFTSQKLSYVPPAAFRLFRTSAKELLQISYPLTLNKVALNLLHSIEAVLIPYALVIHHSNRTLALETLGTVTGMALPLVLFPTAVINALSSLLLPSISEHQALNNRSSIRHLTWKTSFYSIGFGILCTCFFFIFGDFLGQHLYKSTAAGTYVTMLSCICPFLFLNIVLASVMNGLGKTFLCFSVNFFNMCFRVGCILLLVPKIGITGYLFGLIGGELCCTLLSILIIRQKTVSTNN